MWNWLLNVIAKGESGRRENPGVGTMRRAFERQGASPVEPAIKKQILSDLDLLSPEQQRRAAELVHRMVSATPKGTPGRDLLRFAGTLDDESAREMIEAIEEGCEQVNPDEW